MVDEAEVRELIGRMTAAQRQGFQVTPAGIKVVVAALRFYLAARTWLAKPHADPHDDAPRKASEKYTRPPAIADMQRLGVIACIVKCDGPGCWNAKQVTFDDLRLDHGTPGPDIPKWRGFRCQLVGHAGSGCRRTGRITGRRGTGGPKNSRLRRQTR